jgi:hypothetical protein
MVMGRHRERYALAFLWGALHAPCNTFRKHGKFAEF